MPTSRQTHPASDARALFAFFTLCLLAFVLKSPDAYVDPQFWAEDGTVFFQQQWNHGWPQVFVPYAGYLHVIPRLVAWAASFFPIVWAPTLHNFANLGLCAAGVAYMLWRLESPRLATLLFLGLFLTPTGRGIFGTLTNLQWFLQLAMVAACFIPARRLHGWRQPALLFGLLMCALTGPFSAMLVAIHAGLLGLAALFLRFRPAMGLAQELRGYLDGLDRTRLSILWLGGLAQVIAVMLAPAQPSGGELLPTVLAALGGVTQTHTFGHRIMPASMFLALLVCLCAGAALARLPARLKGCILVLSALALLEVAAGCAKSGLMGDSLGSGDRYFVLFKAMFWLLAWIGASWLLSSRRAQAWPMLVACLILVAAINGASLQRPRIDGPKWRDGVASMVPGQPAEIPISPSRWKVRLTPPVPEPAQ